VSTYFRTGPDLPAPCSKLLANSPWDRQLGESDKAFDAFTCYLDLGPTRSMRAVSDQTGQTLDAINKLSSRHRWRSRSAALQQHLIEVRRNQAKIEAETEKTNAAKSWKDRTSDFREREFQAVQKLLATAQQVLDQIQFQDPDKMNFSDACRAFNIASKIGRLTLGMKPDSTPFDDPESDPYMAGWEVALKKVYGRKNPDQNDDPTAEPEATPSNQTPPLPGSPKPSP
jgi:hypothetical protein